MLGTRYPRGQWTWKRRPIIQVWQWRLRGLTAGGNGNGRNGDKRRKVK